MKCAHCEKRLKGGFKEPDGTFPCAKCLVRKVETNTMLFAVTNALTVFNEILKPGHRPRKREIDEGARWLRSICAIRREPG